MILDDIKIPKDIKSLNIDELYELCNELRQEIIRITNKNGGHLGSNLGDIELIVAIHYVFDIETEKLIFDVGHQSYAHKMLTGRRGLMENLRSCDGASGFPDPLESKYDHFIAGHASTSLSAALGIAKARDIKQENFKVLTLLGDGALSGGMIYEALNNVSKTKDFIVILNDNQMSISKSVGSMRKYLTKLLNTKGGLLCRSSLRKLLKTLPERKSQKIESFIKSTISAFCGHNMFEEFGLQYIGPKDGHNLKALIKTLKNIKYLSTSKPIILHAITQKGKGYKEAESDKNKLHGIKTVGLPQYTDIFSSKIVQLAEKDPKIVCITAAMKDGTGLLEFAEKFPDRFFDVGIAEEHAVTFAAGLAIQGMKPYVCIYSTFLQRAFDQIYHDVFLQNLPVRFIVDKAGFPGRDGKTHSGIYDTSMFCNFPTFTVLSPSSAKELELMLEYSANDMKNPIAIRFPKSEAFGEAHSNNFSLKSKIVNEGNDILIFSFGDLLTNIWEAVTIAKVSPTIIDARCAMPLDTETLYNYAKNYRKILVLDEGVWNGFSSNIVEQLIKDKKYDILQKITFLNADKNPVRHESRMKQQKSNNLSAERIAKLLKN